MTEDLPDSRGSYRFTAIDRHIMASREAGCDILWQSSYDVGVPFPVGYQEMGRLKGEEYLLTW
jgi:hypothetical protein